MVHVAMFGGIAFQLTKTEGVFVFGTNNPEKVIHAKMLGVDVFISCNVHFEDFVQDVDAVLDLVGGEMMERSYTVLKPGGRYVTSLVSEVPQDEPLRRGIRSMGLATSPNSEIQTKIAERIDSGVVSDFINRKFPLGDTNPAMLHRMQTKAHGKVVLTIDQIFTILTFQENTC
jgi:NADPH:quinone reductase-like Zn-dependent oxidoreductase